MNDPQELLDKVIGGVRLEKVIGKGGMGVVYCGWHLSLHKKVAVKILSSSLSRDTEFIRRFIREGLSAARLKHPNLVKVYDRGKEGPFYFIVMEWLVGESLRQMIDRQGSLPYRKALAIIIQAGQGIVNAHAKGIIHRDLKPDNLIISISDNRRLMVKVVDFGLARSFTEESQITMPGIPVGTPEYMSPEQCRGEPLDVRTDIYSLGITLYEALTARNPFQAATPLMVLHRQTTEIPSPVDLINPRVPRKLSMFVGKMMAKEAADRYNNMQECVEALHAFLTQSIKAHQQKVRLRAQTTLVRPVTPPPQDTQIVKILFFISAGLFILLVLLVLFY